MIWAKPFLGQEHWPAQARVFRAGIKSRQQVLRHQCGFGRSPCERSDIKLLYRTRNKTAKMNRIVALSSRLSTLILGCCMALALTLASLSPAHAQIAVMVNGEPITNYDIEQRSKLLMLSTHKMQIGR